MMLRGQAVRDRFRAIFLTSITTIAGMLPLFSETSLTGTGTYTTGRQCGVWHDVINRIAVTGTAGSLCDYGRFRRKGN